MTALRGRIAPIGRNCTNHDSIARLETAHFGADLMHDADGLMPQCKIFPWANRPSHRMRIRSTDKLHRRLYDGIQRTRPRHRLLSKPNLPNRLHYERLHGFPRFASIFGSDRTHQRLTAMVRRVRALVPRLAPQAPEWIRCLT